MKLLHTVAQMRQFRQGLSQVGFVPTMGALHAGHCALVSESIRNNAHTIVSIFVNPSQFAPHEDLTAYPRTLDADMEMLKREFGSRVDAVFVPPASEMYPQGVPLEVDSQRGAFVSVLGVSEQLEGVARPHFFRGVATVVTKLLNVVQPNNLYVGQKDAQQCVVLRNLVRDLLINTSVNVVPTLREKNGLAMSSRNAYLTETARDKCSAIYRALSQAQKEYQQGQTSAGALKTGYLDSLASQGFDVEYVAISDPNSLEDLDSVVDGAIMSTAVRVKRDDGGIARLIDNVILRSV